jgi:hypothetical protein
MKLQPARADAATTSPPAERRPVRPPVRDGTRADLATRLLASLVLAGLVALSFSGPAVTFTVLKISLLVAIELGLVSLLLGLFLGARTSFAGLQLVVAPAVMLFLHRAAHPYLATAVGGMVLAVGLAALVVGRSVPGPTVFDAEWWRRLVTGSPRKARGRPAGDAR